MVSGAVQEPDWHEADGVRLVALGVPQQGALQYGARYNGSLKYGVSNETLAAIAEGRRPDNMPEDEALVYDFCSSDYGAWPARGGGGYMFA